MKKQFLLGVGCQKGGTTWLHSQLIKAPQFGNGFAKEYHFFDSLYLRDRQHIARIRQERLSHFLRESRSIVPASLLWQCLFLIEDNAYYSYFDSLWRSSDRVAMVGDITPAYCGLNWTHFREIRAKLESFGFDVKVVFIMRDPFERIYSSVRASKKRMLRFSGSTLVVDGSLPPEDEDLLLSAYKDPGIAFRTRYDLTMQNLEKAFAPDQIFYTLYEDLFRPPCLSRMASFLGVDVDIFDAGQFLNVSPRSGGIISEAIVRQIVDYYSDVYEFVSHQFAVEGKWKSFDL